MTEPLAGRIPFDLSHDGTHIDAFLAGLKDSTVSKFRDGAYIRDGIVNVLDHLHAEGRIAWASPIGSEPVGRPGQVQGDQQWPKETP